MSASALVLAGVTALLSSLLTCAVLLVAARLLLRRWFDRNVERAGDLVASRVRRAVEEGATEMLPRLRAEVKGGLEDGAEEVLPRIRAELKQGVEEAGEAMIPRFRGEVRGGFEEAAEAVLPRLRSEVEAGLKSAGEEMLPRMREEVRDGLAEGLTSSLGKRILGERGEEIARKGSSALFGFLFGEEE